MRKLNTLTRDIRYCQSPQPTGDTLGRWSLLPASIVTSEKKTIILQTQLPKQDHSPKYWRRSYFSLVQWPLQQLGQENRYFHEPARKDGVTGSLWLHFCVFCWRFTEMQKTDPFFTPRAGVFLKVTLEIVPRKSNKYLHTDETVRRTWIWLTTNRNSILDITGFRYNKYVRNWNNIYYLGITVLIYMYILKNIILDGQGSGLPNKTRWGQIF